MSQNVSISCLSKSDNHLLIEFLLVTCFPTLFPYVFTRGRRWTDYNQYGTTTNASKNLKKALKEHIESGHTEGKTYIVNLIFHVCPYGFISSEKAC